MATNFVDDLNTGDVTLCAEEFSVHRASKKDTLTHPWKFFSLSDEGATYHEGFEGVIAESTAVSLEYDPSQMLLLEKHKAEREVILSRINYKSNVDLESMDPFDCFCLALPPNFLPQFAEWLEFKVSLIDLIHFLRAEVVLRAFNFSVSRFQTMRHKLRGDYSACMNAHRRVQQAMETAGVPFHLKTAKSSRSRAPPRCIDPALVKMQQTCNAYWRDLFFCPDHTWLIFDNERLPDNSMRWEEYGLSLQTTRDGLEQSMMHVVSSASSQFLFGGWADERKKKVSEILQSIILTLFDKDAVEELDPVKVRKLLLFTDRESIVLSKCKEDKVTNLVQILQEYGVGFLGTCRESSSFPFGMCKRISDDAAKRRPEVLLSGCRSAFTAQCEDIYATVFRQGQGKPRGGQVVTNFAPLKKISWVFQLSRGYSGGVKRKAHVDPVAAEEEEDPVLSAFLRMEGGVYQMTLEQRTQDWYLARHFVSTHKVIHNLINCQDADYLTDGMKDLHVGMLQAAMLSPRAEVTFASALEMTQAKKKRRRSSENVRLSRGQQDNQEQISTTSSWRKGICEDANTSEDWSNAKTIGGLRNVCKEFRNPYSGNVEKSRTEIATASHVGNLSIIEHLRERRNHLLEESEIEEDNPARLDCTESGEEEGDSECSDFDEEEDSDCTESGEEEDSDELEENDGSSVQSCRKRKRVGIGSCRSASYSTNTPRPLTAEERQRVFLTHILRRWFVPPLGRSGESCSLNEGSNASDSESFRNQVDAFLRVHSDFAIMQGREYGLVTSRSSMFAATWTDGVCALGKRVPLEGPLQFDRLCAMEVKTSTRTIPESSMSLAQRRFVHCLVGTNEFRHAVPNPSHRTQVIHQAAVFDLQSVLLVFRTRRMIERCVLVDVNQACRTAWRHFHDMLQDEYMGFVHREDSLRKKLPRLGPDGNCVYGYAVEHHTVEMYIALWLKHRDDVLKNGTPPPCLRLVPLVVSTWNDLMGSVHSVRKTLSENRVTYDGLSPSSLTWMSFLSYTLHNAFRLYQLARVDPETAFSFEQLKDKWDKISSFNQFLDSLSSALDPLKGRGHELPLRVPTLVEIDQRFRRQVPQSVPVETNAPPLSPARPNKSKKTLEYNLLQRANSDPAFIKARCSTPMHTSRDMTRNKRNRCAVCCEMCVKGKPHTSRMGYKTSSFCKTCGVRLCTKGRNCWTLFHTQRRIDYPPCVPESKRVYHGDNVVFN